MTIKSGLVLQIKQLIDLLKKEVSIGIEWVRGHTGVVANELADMLAKDGTTIATHGCALWLPITKSDFKKDIRTFINREWQKRWKEEEDCKITKSFLPTVNRDRFKLIKGETIVNLKLMVAIITGHGFLGGHLKKLNHKFSPFCNFCKDEIETSHHLFDGCQETAHFRVQDRESPKVILKYFTEKFFLRELYKENINKY